MNEELCVGCKGFALAGGLVCERCGANLYDVEIRNLADRYDLSSKYKPVQAALHSHIDTARFPIDTEVIQLLEKETLSPPEAIFLASITRGGQLEQFCQTGVDGRTAYDISGEIVDSSPLWGDECGMLIGITKKPPECSYNVQDIVASANVIQASKLSTTVGAERRLCVSYALNRVGEYNRATELENEALDYIEKEIREYSRPKHWNSNASSLKFGYLHVRTIWKFNKGLYTETVKEFEGGFGYVRLLGKLASLKLSGGEISPDQLGELGYACYGEYHRNRTIRKLTALTL
jgi:hypothetical protein